MRIILLLAAAGAAAIATAAAARPGGGSPGPGARAGWAAVQPGRHQGIRGGWEGRSRPGMRRGRDERHGRRPGRAAPDGLFFYDGFGMAGPTGLVDPWGNGFFAAGGGEVRIRRGRPHYDYDRSYPYEWAPSDGSAEAREEEGEPVDPPPPSCTFEHGVRVCRGR